MAKAKKAKDKKPRATEYDKKLAVKGSFIEIMKAAAKHADNNSTNKKP